jgi:hypothetical protein
MLQIVTKSLVLFSSQNELLYLNDNTPVSVKALSSTCKCEQGMWF